jgi:hypothetical protein
MEHFLYESVAFGMQPGYPKPILKTTAYQDAGLNNEALFY